jgi:hypothetical protein
MKKYLCLQFLFLIQLLSFAQNKIIKDLDGDSKEDSVYLDYKKSKIICVLSSLKYNKIESREIEMGEEHSRLETTKSGFKLSINWMRAGYDCQFRFNTKTKIIQLIGMSRYELGPATLDGSGESSINLLTNSYIGNWNYFNPKKEKLFKIPTIKVKMVLPKTSLDNFDENTYFKYAEKCSELFEIQKSKMMKSEK